MVDDGVVKVLNVEETPPSHDLSSAATLCSMVDRSL
jgi:peroxiredoxin